MIETLQKQYRKCENCAGIKMTYKIKEQIKQKLEEMLEGLSELFDRLEETNVELKKYRNQIDIYHDIEIKIQEFIAFQFSVLEAKETGRRILKIEDESLCREIDKLEKIWFDLENKLYNSDISENSKLGIMEKILSQITYYKPVSDKVKEILLEKKYFDKICQACSKAYVSFEEMQELLMRNKVFKCISKNEIKNYLEMVKPKE